MSEELWTAVDRYINDLLIPPDPVLDAALEAGDKAGLPQISVTPSHGKLLYLLARILDARRVLELGTLAGYSTIWLARALPATGCVVTLESDPKHAEVAATNFARAELGSKVDLRVGLALDSLPRLAREGMGPFDLIFIDADKQNIPAYFEWSLELSRPRSVIVVDNVVREGAVIDASSEDPSVRGVRKFHEMLRTERRVSATTIQTVGSKGYDGFTIVLVNRPTH
jgi:predicted O-methyltransferase YrrM